MYTAAVGNDRRESELLLDELLECLTTILTDIPVVCVTLSFLFVFSVNIDC